MKFQIYHQLGHNASWNMQSLEEELVGEGVIIAPRFMSHDNVVKLDSSIRKKAIFDPQFFIPNSQIGQLGTYNFFPDVVSDGFDTTEYPEASARESARRCVEFQAINDFRYLVVPTRYYPGIPSSYISLQNVLFVDPFLEEVQAQGLQKPILIQLILNEEMLKDKVYFSDLLNWITSYDKIQGVYLIIKRAKKPKQIRDIPLLVAWLNFIHALKLNDLKVVLGYLNTEAMLLALASPDIVTIGSYENTRMFDPKNFEIKDENQMSGPTPRVYIPSLMQLINHNYLNALAEALPDVELFEENQYKITIFEPTYKWWFSKPDVYKYNFKVFSNHLLTLGQTTGYERYLALCEMIDTARNNYAILEEEGTIVLDAESDGSHLPAWRTAANLFAKEQGWK